jgi:NAD(P)-dependent dehydrogenase (short-subunit alcohol dehydrogenase family)
MRAALVTGGAKRLGAAIVRTLADAGHPVVVHYRSSAAAAESLAGEIRAAGGTAFTIGADLADPDQVATVIERAVGLAGPLGVLVNSASRFEYDSARTVTAATIEAHVGPNLAAPVLLARHFAEQPDAAGVIVNILDQKLANLNPDFFSYTLAKAGLGAATEMLAMALAPRIRVCGVAPGLTLIGPKQSEDSFRKGREATPLGRGTEPEDIAAAVLFAIRTQSMTGTTLYVDAGEHLMRRQRDVSVNPA